MEENKTLGIYVTSDQHLDKVLRISRAAIKKKVAVMVFFTHIGTRLSKEPEFVELTQLAKVSLCKVGFEANQLEKPVEGLEDSDFATQSWHAEMIYDCDRYITF